MGRNLEPWSPRFAMAIVEAPALIGLVYVAFWFRKKLAWPDTPKPGFLLTFLLTVGAFFGPSFSRRSPIHYETKPC